MHLNKYEIRAFYDRELGEAEMQRINTHLADCPSCQNRIEAISQRADWMQSQLEMLSPLPEEPSLSVMAARSHLNDILKKEHKIMFKKYFIAVTNQHGQRSAWS
jgi:predicted anti-sigma-YlaC factor YlaD